MAAETEKLTRPPDSTQGTPMARLGRITMVFLLMAASSTAAEKGKLKGRVPADQDSRAGWKVKPSSQTPENQNPGLAAARQRVLQAQPLGMYYYLDDNRAFESLKANATGMTLLAPQCFWVDSEGFVHGAIPPRVSELTRGGSLPLMPLVVNPAFDRGTVTALLRHTKAQERAISYLAYLANRDNYVGFQIDLENIDPGDQKLLTRFVEGAAARLHRDGRLLSVAVVPRFPDPSPGSSRPGEPAASEWAAAYDYAALGRAADFLALMTYDHSSRNMAAGPIAGYEWVRRALDYAVQRVPREKLLLGLAFYGREWIETDQGTAARSLGFSDVQALLERPEITARWDARWRSPWLQFRNGLSLHTVWFENHRSLDEKLRLMQEYRLRGFAAWRLGAEDPQFWPLAAALGNRAAPPRSKPRSLPSGGEARRTKNPTRRGNPLTAF